ncbi:MAG: hypothetical protein JNM38_04000 [Acidobacteria bacterium]|jgi:hypothetical protein|nr:hypothetical protein [Acidobacteriota bacterium]
MNSHLLWLVVFSLCVSIVFAVLQRDAPREQVKLTAQLAGGFLAAALVMGWVLRLFPLGA